MNWIDTHCHLANGRLIQQTADVIQRAKQADVPRIICAAADLHESKTALHLAQQYDGIYFMCGTHPHDAAEAPEDYLQTLESLANRERNVAIGEIGLDYHYEYSPREMQKKVFAEQLELSTRIDKPIVIHTREAFDDTMDILQSATVRHDQVLFHSFTGNREQVQRVLQFGAMISYSGIATFKNATDIREGILDVPDDRIMIETDAPFLSPEPVRKMKTNEPANVTHTGQFLAELRNTTPEAFADQTTFNAVRFFRITK